MDRVGLTDQLRSRYTIHILGRVNSPGKDHHVKAHKENWEDNIAVFLCVPFQHNLQSTEAPREGIVRESKGFVRIDERTTENSDEEDTTVSGANTVEIYGI